MSKLASILTHFSAVLGLTALCAVGSPLFAQDGKLSIPDLPPKPLVWIDDWQPAEEQVSPIREAARFEMRVADQLKSAEQFERAETKYLRAMQIDPLWAYPPYQLACNYELSNQHNKAVVAFAKAMKLGFDDFPTAFSDDELGQLRSAPDIQKTLSEIRNRYIKVNKKRVGRPIAVRPDGDAPAKGWPLILLLHGYGDTNESYVSLAQEWSKLGFVAVAVPGSVPGRAGGFIWSLESTEPTLRDIRVITANATIRKITNPRRIFLLGFSQGALHSLLLTSLNRDEFAGVVALSPGGSLAQQMVRPKIAKGRSAKLVFIHGTEEPHAPIAGIWKTACQSAGWEYLGRTHEGGHHFPADWDKQRSEIAKFLIE